jgi:hypothetical protein
VLPELPTLPATPNEPPAAMLPVAPLSPSPFKSSMPGLGTPWAHATDSVSRETRHSDARAFDNGSPFAPRNAERDALATPHFVYHGVCVRLGKNVVKYQCLPRFLHTSSGFVQLRINATRVKSRHDAEGFDGTRCAA